MRCEVCGQGSGRKHFPSHHDDAMGKMDRCKSGIIDQSDWRMHEPLERLGRNPCNVLLTVDLLEDWMMQWPDDAPTWETVSEKLYLEHVIKTIRDVQSGLSYWVAKQRRAAEANLEFAAWMAKIYADKIPCTYSIRGDRYPATAKLHGKTLTVTMPRDDEKVARIDRYTGSWRTAEGRVRLGPQVSSISRDD